MPIGSLRSLFRQCGLCKSESLQGPWGAVAKARTHEQPEVEGGRVKQQMFANVPAPAHMHSAQTAGLTIAAAQAPKRVTEFAVEVMGSYAMPQQPRLLEYGSLNELIGVPSAKTAVSVCQYFGDRCITIAGGTTEVQKKLHR